MSDELRVAIRAAVEKEANHSAGPFVLIGSTTETVYAAVLPLFAAERERGDRLEREFNNYLKAEAELLGADTCTEGCENPRLALAARIALKRQESEQDDDKKYRKYIDDWIRQEFRRLRGRAESAEKGCESLHEMTLGIRDQRDAYAERAEKAESDLSAARQELSKCREQVTEACLLAGQHEGRAAKLELELAETRKRLLTAAGDDLCRLTQEEIKAMTSGAVPIPPLSEFLASCERFHAQVASEAGVNNNCLTLAQLVAENEKLQQELAESHRSIACLQGNIKTWESSWKMAIERDNRTSGELAETKRRLEETQQTLKGSLQAHCSNNRAYEELLARNRLLEDVAKASRYVGRQTGQDSWNVLFKAQDALATCEKT